MAFRIDDIGLKIGSSEVIVDNKSVNAVVLNGHLVWIKFDTPSPVEIEGDGDLEAGIDFPAGVPLKICVVGGGGSGASSYDIGHESGGGFAGETTLVEKTFPLGEIVSVVIGKGGAPRLMLHGLPGTETKFGSYATSAGGGGGIIGFVDLGNATYKGLGEYKASICGDGTYDGQESKTDVIYNRIGYGGEASGVGDGGKGETDYLVPAGSGIHGSGGGGHSRTSTLVETSGAGGDGVIKISW